MPTVGLGDVFSGYTLAVFQSQCLSGAYRLSGAERQQKSCSPLDMLRRRGRGAQTFSEASRLTSSIYRTQDLMVRKLKLEPDELSIACEIKWTSLQNIQQHTDDIRLKSSQTRFVFGEV